VAVIERGLQPERTALAWRRTSLSVAANGLLLLRTSLAAGSTSVSMLSAIVLACSGLVFILSAHRGERLRLSRAAVNPLMALLLVGCTVLACAAELLVIAGT